VVPVIGLKRKELFFFFFKLLFFTESDGLVVKRDLLNSEKKFSIHSAHPSWLPAARERGGGVGWHELGPVGVNHQNERGEGRNAKFSLLSLYFCVNFDR
jgi:hypothetical protein